MLRKFVSVSFHSFSGEGAASSQAAVYMVFRAVSPHFIHQENATTSTISGRFRIQRDNSTTRPDIMMIHVDKVLFLFESRMASPPNRTSKKGTVGKRKRDILIKNEVKMK